MKIGVLSDTHVPTRARSVPAPVLQAFQGVDAILHAGDLADESVLRQLERLAPVYAVRGNVDPPNLWHRLPARRLVTLGGVRIGLVHGDGTSGSTVERARRAFRADGVDCIVFGHSHEPYCERRDGVLLFNPGSPTDRRRQPQHSYGFLTITDGRVEGRILYF